jgi:hypothetical protein
VRRCNSEQFKYVFGNGITVQNPLQLYILIFIIKNVAPPSWQDAPWPGCQQIHTVLALEYLLSLCSCLAVIKIIPTVYNPQFLAWESIVISQIKTHCIVYIQRVYKYCTVYIQRVSIMSKAKMFYLSTVYMYQKSNFNKILVNGGHVVRKEFKLSVIDYWWRKKT